MKATLVLEPEDGESAEVPVIIAEVVAVEVRAWDGGPSMAAAVTYLETMQRLLAAKKLGREPEGWPVQVFIQARA